MKDRLDVHADTICHQVNPVDDPLLCRDNKIPDFHRNGANLLECQVGDSLDAIHNLTSVNRTSKTSSFL